MNWQLILETIWAAVNSPAAIAAAAGLLIWLLNRLYAAKPEWKKFEGAIITAIELAEHEIPDTAENKGLKRLDAALQFALKIYYQTQDKSATPDVVDSLREGIQIKYAELKAAGNVGE